MGISSIVFSVKTSSTKLRQKEQHKLVAILSIFTGLVFLGKVFSKTQNKLPTGGFIALSVYYTGTSTWRAICHWIFVLFFEICLALGISLAFLFSVPSTVGASVGTPGGRSLIGTNDFSSKDKLLINKSNIISISPEDFDD